jgi:hypothetical protein
VTTRTFIASPVIYPGMPKSRESEENEINLGSIKLKTTDLPTLILINCALIYMVMTDAGTKFMPGKPRLSLFRILENISA